MKASEFISEEKVRLDPRCWKGKKIGNPKTKVKGGVRVNNCVPVEETIASLTTSPGNSTSNSGSGEFRGVKIPGTMKHPEWREPTWSFQEIAEKLGIPVSALNLLAFKRIKGFPEAMPGISSRYGSKKYYKQSEVKRWVNANNVREKIKQGIAEGWKEKVGAAALAGAMATGAGANTPKVPLDQAIRDATAVYNINKAVKKQKEKSKEETPKKTDKNLKEFAPDGFNGGDDGEEFNPRLAKMAYDEGVVKGVSLADGATLKVAMAINDWDKHDGGIYKQHFAKGFKAGRMNKINHDNKRYNLNLKLMKDGSVRHGEQGLSEVFDTKAAGAWDNAPKSYGMEKFVFTASNGIQYRLDFLDPGIGPEEMGPESFEFHLGLDDAVFDKILDRAKFVEFEQVNTKDPHGTGKQGIEGTGAAAEVFGSVVNAILTYIKKHKPSMLYFQAVEPNRRRLYTSMVNRLLKYLPGWGFERGGPADSMFAIYNTRLLKQPTAKEDAADVGVAEGLEDTQKKIEDTINKLEDRLKHAKTPEQWDNIKNRIERLQAGLKRSKQSNAVPTTEGQVPNWSDLPNSLSTEDKISIFESYYVNNALLESAEHSVEYFNGLSEYSTEPDQGKKYIVVPLMLIQNRVLPLNDQLLKLTFVSRQGKDYVFTDGNKTLNFPRDFSSIQGQTKTFVFGNYKSYDKFRSALAMKFDLQLPAAKPQSDDQGVAEDWQKVNKSDKTDGMSPKAVKAYRRENPGSKLKTAVTTKPSKLKPGSKDAKRRKSFCARMSGNPGPMKDEKGRPTPKAKALKRWNC